MGRVCLHSGWPEVFHRIGEDAVHYPILQVAQDEKQILLFSFIGRDPFASFSKPFSYAIATQELGQATVDKYVSHEPSGRNFDEIVLDPNGECKENMHGWSFSESFLGKPHNPMLNSGALMTSGVISTLVAPDIPSYEKFEYVQRYFQVRTLITTISPIR